MSIGEDVFGKAKTALGAAVSVVSQMSLQVAVKEVAQAVQCWWVCC